MFVLVVAMFISILTLKACLLGNFGVTHYVIHFNNTLWFKLQNLERK